MEGRYIGRTQSPLAQEGIQALLELKRKGIYPEAKKYYASPCVRCVDTLKVLYPTADPEVVLELAECDFGDWENKKAEELKNDPKFVAWMNGGQHEAPPNGESSIVFMQRVCAGFEMLVKNMMMTGDESAVLVTHGGVIMTILAAYGLPRAKMTDWMCENGHGYSMRIDPCFGGTAWRQRSTKCCLSSNRAKSANTASSILQEKLPTALTGRKETAKRNSFP